MRRLLILALVIVAASCSVDRHPDPSAPSDSIRAELFAARNAVWRAWFEGDSAALVSILPETMVAMDHDRAEIIRQAIDFRNGGGQLISIAFTDDELLVRDDMAVVWSRYRVETSTGGSRRIITGLASEIFTREQGRWINPHWTLRDEKSTLADTSRNTGGSNDGE